jgi:hypothetical protein
MKPGKKKCARCRKQKPTSAFGEGAKWPDGLYPYCRPCRVAYNREWREKNPAKARAARSRKTETMRRFREKHGLTYGDISRMSRYGVSPADYEGMLRRQDGRCAICGDPPGSRRTGCSPKFDIDHCHKTGSVRGLLCGPCNRGLGHFRDDLDTLRKAVAFLERS